MSNHRPRRAALTPKSAAWTLYKPGPMSQDLGVDQDRLESELERHGFAKAVRIREQVIREKEILRYRVKVRRKLIERAKARLAEDHRLQMEDERKLAMLRDILRLPRENPEGWPPREES